MLNFNTLDKLVPGCICRCNWCLNYYQVTEPWMSAVFCSPECLKKYILRRLYRKPHASRLPQ